MAKRAKEKVVQCKKKSTTNLYWETVCVYDRSRALRVNKMHLNLLAKKTKEKEKKKNEKWAKKSEKTTTSNNETQPKRNLVVFHVHFTHLTQKRCCVHKPLQTSTRTTITPAYTHAHAHANKHITPHSSLPYCCQSRAGFSSQASVACRYLSWHATFRLLVNETAGARERGECEESGRERKGEKKEVRECGGGGRWDTGRAQLQCVDPPEWKRGGQACVCPGTVVRKRGALRSLPEELGWCWCCGCENWAHVRCCWRAWCKWWFVRTRVPSRMGTHWPFEPRGLCKSATGMLLISLK